LPGRRDARAFEPLWPRVEGQASNAAETPRKEPNLRPSGGVSGGQGGTGTSSLGSLWAGELEAVDVYLPLPESVFEVSTG
jgi:hypothetical protein